MVTLNSKAPGPRAAGAEGWDQRCDLQEHRAGADEQEEKSHVTEATTEPAASFPVGETA